MEIVGLRILGHVQGVGFRWWTRTRAERLGLRGIVRNDSDGSVVVVAEGDEAALRTLCELLEQGPPGAIVERVTPLDRVEMVDLPKEGFEIAR